MDTYKKLYRYGIDDNICIFKDLSTNPDAYSSLFDHYYLKFWYDINQEYGTKIHLNIYYQTSDYNLTQMPEKWKNEWRKNSNWLNLSFHALKNTPAHPYKNSTYKEVKRDYDKVVSEIERFAGSEVISRVTTIHFTETTYEGAMALKDGGIKILIGLFWSENNGSYYLNQKEVDLVNQRGVWKDENTGLIFVLCTAVINNLSLWKIPIYLKNRIKNTNSLNKIELMFHEQYLRKDSNRYYDEKAEKKVKKSIEWVTKRGYEPSFWNEKTLEY